ncbi:hypothetical protein MSR1_26340 [Magnetospirillum gryphiswaldense MSR-1]|nr:hypothetical protein MSR1_26340 [Magnetospirillum gryphiswaldense MSR-1]AVM79017.1 hypothetical protein MSR1L_26340 [Magnetospirillum gryphiswaldense]
MDQIGHMLPAVNDKAEKIVGVGVNPPLVALFKQLGVTNHIIEWGLEIM